MDRESAPRVNRSLERFFFETGSKGNGGEKKREERFSHESSISIGKTFKRIIVSILEKQWGGGEGGGRGMRNIGASSEDR